MKRLTEAPTIHPETVVEDSTLGAWTDIGAPVASAVKKARIAQDRQVRRQRVLSLIERARDLACGHPLWACAHQQAQSVQAAALAEGRERAEGVSRIHES